MCGVVLSFYFKDSEDSEKDLKYEGLFTKYCFSVTYPWNKKEALSNQIGCFKRL